MGCMLIFFAAILDLPKGVCGLPILSYEFMDSIVHYYGVFSQLKLLYITILESYSGRGRKNLLASIFDGLQNAMSADKVVLRPDKV